MSSSLAYSRDLFVAQNGTPMNFNISRCVNIAQLQNYIEYGGGVVQGNIGPFTIILEDDPQDSSTVPQELYQSDFIIQCCSQNKILPLTKFRCSSVSFLPAEFDPNDILHHKISWENAKQQYKQASEDSDSAPSISIDEEQYTLTHSNGPRKSMRSKREEFTQLERKKMVEFIVQTKSFGEVTGTSLWKRMHLKLQNHTWQSLKEHFMKRIMPFIQTYNLSSNEIQHFRRSMKVKHSIKCSYSTHEDDLILKYISHHANPKTPLGGNQFWKKMQEKPHVPGRTWHSVRERYLKCLRNKTPPVTPTRKSEGDIDAECVEIESVPSTSAEPSTSKRSERIVEEEFVLPSKRQKCNLFSPATTIATQFSPMAVQETRHCLMENNVSSSNDTRSGKLSVTVNEQNEERGDESSPDATSIQESFGQQLLAEITRDDQIPPPHDVCTQGDEGVESSDSVDHFFSTDQIPPPLSASTQKLEGVENFSDVNHASCNSENQPDIPSKSFREADRECQEKCSVEPTPPGQDTSSQWPSNFPPEQVFFISECKEESTSEISEEEANEDDELKREDSEWSDNGLCCRGGVVFPTGLKAVNRDHPGHPLIVGTKNNLHESNGELIPTRSEDKRKTNNSDLCEKRVKNCLESKERDNLKISSYNCKSRSGTVGNATFDFLPALNNSYDESERTQNLSISCNGTEQFNSESYFTMPLVAEIQDYCEQTNNLPFEDACPEKPHQSNVTKKNISNKSKSVGVQVRATMCNKRHVAVQTDSVLVLPKGWSFSIEDQPAPPPSTLSIAPPVAAHPGGCLSPVPANLS